MLKAIPFNEPILLILKNNISYSEKKRLTHNFCV